MKREFSCQDHVHFLRFSVLRRCILESLLISLALGALYFGSFGKLTVHFLALRVLGGGSSVPVLISTAIAIAKAVIMNKTCWMCITFVMCLSASGLNHVEDCKRGYCTARRGVELIDEEEYIVSFMFVFSFVNFRLIDWLMGPAGPFRSSTVSVPQVHFVTYGGHMGLESYGRPSPALVRVCLIRSNWVFESWVSERARESDLSCTTTIVFPPPHCHSCHV